MLHVDFETNAEPLYNKSFKPTINQNLGLPKLYVFL